MQQSNQKGSYANNQGKVLEETVISTCHRKGFEVLMYRDWAKAKDNYGDELLLKNVPFKSIYNHDGNTEFLLLSKKYSLEMRIECKWQQSPGSVDEKLPYLYLNCIEAMPEKRILIILDGNGAKKGAVEWLKRAAGDKLYTSKNNDNKQIDICNLQEFIRWANITFR